VARHKVLAVERTLLVLLLLRTPVMWTKTRREMLSTHVAEHDI
jgi:hypothetical protein